MARRVTASDVRYGILRTLDPANGSIYAYVLSVIRNAESYNMGVLTDATQVGVVALDNNHLRIILERPAAYLLSILAMWFARPMPQWAIDAWGAAWTEPAHIVTNGPYRLAQWDHNRSILLTKNPTYYDAPQVQIDSVRMYTADDATAWNSYLNGSLDTASVPPGTTLNPLLSQEAHWQTSACNCHLGFSVSQPPFDQPLVRKAFAAATDRVGLLRDVAGTLGRRLRISAATSRMDATE